MRKLTYVFVLVFALCAAAALGQAPEEKAEDSLKIEWVNNFDDAQAKALTENKVILLDFFSDT
jgi:hypothetical protein